MKAPLLSLVEITCFEKTGGPLTKRIYFKPDGAIANDSSDCRTSSKVWLRAMEMRWLLRSAISIVCAERSTL
jgi:hypothetical protein